jgi:hypothetical protein
MEILLGDLTSIDGLIGLGLGLVMSLLVNTLDILLLSIHVFYSIHILDQSWHSFRFVFSLDIFNPCFLPLPIATHTLG